MNDQVVYVPQMAYIAERVNRPVRLVQCIQMHNEAEFAPLVLASIYNDVDQILVIEGAVVNRPKLLIADEPTGNLDPTLSREIMLLFEQFNQVGVTVLIASHDLELIGGMDKRIMAVGNGRLMKDAGVPSRVA